MEAESIPEFRTNFFIALGKYSYNFSFIEEAMKLLINSLLDVKNNDIGACLTADMPFKALYHSLMSLYRLKEKEPTMIGKLENVLSNVEILEKRRNKLIHSIWQLDPTTNTAKRLKRTAKFGTGLNRDDKEYDLSEFDKEIILLQEACKVILNILEQWEQNNSLAE
jgi:hypothetical protein